MPDLYTINPLQITRRNPSLSTVEGRFGEVPFYCPCCMKPAWTTGYHTSTSTNPLSSLPQCWELLRRYDYYRVYPQPYTLGQDKDSKLWQITRAIGGFRMAVLSATPPTTPPTTRQWVLQCLDKLAPISSDCWLYSLNTAHYTPLNLSCP